MEGPLSKVVYIAIGLVVLFLMLSSILMPTYNTTGAFNNTLLAGGSNTGMTNATYQGLLMLCFILGIIGIAMAFFSNVRRK